MNDTPNRKRAILQAALQCFTEHGVAATTIEMIRERAGASIGSLYHHFGGKDGIARALFLDAMASYHAQLWRRLEQAATAEAGVRALVSSYIDWIAEQPDRARFVLYSRGYLVQQAAGADLEADGRERISRLLGFFRPFIERGELKRIPMECYASLMIGPAHDYARLWLAGRVRTPLQNHRELFADAAWTALKP